MPRRIPKLLLLMLPISACARPVVDSTAYRQLAPRTSPEMVLVFMDGAPDRPYEELGLIEVRNVGFGPGGVGPMVLRAREEAARMGADAIVVARRTVDTEVTTGSINGNARGRGGTFQSAKTTTEEPRIEVRAIVWKQGGGEP